MTAYRPLVQAAGPGFLIVAFLARLPAAMGPLGVITLVAAATGSFAIAGAVAAAYGIGAATGGPVCWSRPPPPAPSAPPPVLIMNSGSRVRRQARP